jgi:lanthanide-dependent methanol dehydrogenase
MLGGRYGASAAQIFACAMLIGACRDEDRNRSRVVTSPPPAARMAGSTSTSTRAEDGEWPMSGRDYASTRFSGLTQIAPGNVRDLKVAFTFSTGFVRGHEAAPLVVGNTMYLVTPYPNLVYALDLTKPGSTKWSFRPKPSSSAQGVACCDVVNRGVAYSDGRIFFNTLDAYTIALDAETGKELWRTKLGDINKGETITMAPLVVKDKVLVGNSGAEYGVRGWLSALDTRTGALVWRAYATGPDSEVLIGSSFKPFYESDRGKDLGVSTWPPGKWEIGGGTSWGFVSYDPELDLIYYGTANPGPWNPEQRPGDNKWTAGVFARKPDSGEAIWFYQWNPHDLYDWDGINENVLFELELAGARRKVLAHADRNGYLYILDRATGEVLSAEPFAPNTALTTVDLKTGKPIHVEEKKPGYGRTVREICPAPPGAKDWQPMAYSPKTGLLYIPHNNLCSDMEGFEANYIAGTPYVGANVRMYAGPGGHRGEFSAWDPAKAKKVWSIQEKFPVWSGALATDGGVVFYGTMDGYFKAIDATSGALLWQFKVGSGIVGQPITYLGPDKKQYVAVLSGVGGWAGAIVSGDLDPRDGTAALGFVNAMSDLPQHTTRGGMLYVFALP